MRSAKLVTMAVLEFLERPGSLQLSQVQVVIAFFSLIRLSTGGAGSRTYMLVGLRRSLASACPGSVGVGSAGASLRWW